MQEDPNADRKAWMSLLACATPSGLALLLPDLPAQDVLRPAEVGAVMVTGRIGGGGAAFNIGEMTVTRCVVRLRSGQVGHACVQGRDRDHALRAASVDALMQTDRAPEIRRSVLLPLATSAGEKTALRATRAAATKVDFFTMVRGQDT